MKRLLQISFLLALSAPQLWAQVVGVWTQPSTMPTARAQTAIAADPSGKIFVLGGYTGGTASTTVEIYNPTTNTWSTGPSMLTATRGATAVYFNNFIYVFGGFNSSQNAIFQALNLATNTWSQGTFTNGGWEASSAVANGHIIVFGGEFNSTTTFEFLPASGTFTALANNPNGAVGSQAVAFGNQLYLVGGTISYSPSNTHLDTYNVAANTWSTTPADNSLPRTQFVAAGDSRYIYVAGGSSTASNNSSPYYTNFSIYDTVSDQWSTGPSMPIGLRESSAVLVGNTFYVFGGFDANGLVSGRVLAISAVPEPATAALLALGCLSVFAPALRRRRG